jgi:hypothetical protein
VCRRAVQFAVVANGNVDHAMIMRRIFRFVMSPGRT